MPTISCPDSEKLSTYLAGGLPEAEVRAVAEHLDACPACRSVLTALGERQRDLETRLSHAPSAKALGAGGTPKRPGPETGVVTELGEYRLLEKLGEGGMGAVYKAVHTRLDKIVALKMLPQSHKANQWVVSRFDREMKAIGRLNHPNIVQAYDAREIGGTRFLVMEYVDGVDLSAVVERCGPLGIAEACEVARQTALGLQAAHEHGLVHRDIKPSNLMLAVSRQPSGVSSQRKDDLEKLMAESCPLTASVKILDLGLARFQPGRAPGGEVTSAGQIMGTADYIAPEQVSDSHNVDIRADIYSLGCTLFKLLTGEVLFGDAQYEGFFDKMMAHVLKPTPPIRALRSEVPEPLAAVIDRMLAKQPGERFSTPVEVAEALAPFAAGARLAALWRESEARAPAPAPTEKAALPTAESYSTAPRTTAKGPGDAVLAAGREAVGRETQQQGRWPLLRVRPILAWSLGLILLAAGGFVVSRAIAPGGREIEEPAAYAPFDAATTTASTPQGETTPSATKAAPPKSAAKTPEPPAKPPPRKPRRTLPGVAPPRAVAPFDAGQAKKHQDAWAKYLGVPAQQTNSIGTRLVLIPPGPFDMGTAQAAPAAPAKRAQDKKEARPSGGLAGESPQHRVTITGPFCLGACEVTQAEYQRVMGANPSKFSPEGQGRQAVAGQDTARYPVESVSWQEAVEFCRRLSDLAAERSAGWVYRLPTEAEWEYSCRAGTTTAWCCGDDEAALAEYSWFSSLSGETTHAAGQKKPNAWGLYDMHGNVFEWCSDWFAADYYQRSAAEDPPGAASGFERVIRGGSYWNRPTHCRSAARVGSPADGSNLIGFRVACEIDAGD